MKNLGWYVFTIIVVLYVLKVPSVVQFVNGIRDVLLTTWNYVIDVLTHVKERHPIFYIFLPFILLYLIRPNFTEE